MRCARGSSPAAPRHGLGGFSHAAGSAGETRGFTLIELMIVIAVIGILVAIAYPSYREQVVKTRRAEGKAELAKVAQRMERCFTTHNSYVDECDDVDESTSENGWYAVDATTQTATTFTLRAVPQNAQSTDDTKCGTLSLTHTGVRGQSGTPPSGYACW